MTLVKFYSALTKFGIALGIGIWKFTGEDFVLPVKEVQNRHLVERSVNVFINVFQVKTTNEMKHKSYTLAE